MKLQLIPISSKFFTWNTEAGNCYGVTKISDLGPNLILNYNSFQRISDDACEVCFAIKSEKTNKVVEFYFESEVCDPEGNLAAFVFYNADSSIKIWVYND